RVAQPPGAGIYTADPDDLSLTATMPRFAELEKQERSIILGLRRARRRARETGVSGARWSLFVTLKEGMEELVAALATRLQPGTVRLKQRVAGAARPGDRWPVASARGAAPGAGRRRAERGRARAGRRPARDAGTRRAARGARDHGRTGPRARLPVAEGDAAVPRGSPGACGDDRAPRRGAPRPRPRGRRLPRRRD